MSFSKIDIPFEFRGCCWFCKEPSAHQVRFPKSGHEFAEEEYTPLVMPACKECMQIANKCDAVSVTHLRTLVKKQLTKVYKKHLAIGVNWTKEELEESGFDCKIFGGFKESAWMMYEIARDRVNFDGWSLTVASEEVEYEEIDTTFSFDGVDYPDIDSAIVHYSELFTINALDLKHAVKSVGEKRFGYAVRFCRAIAADPVASRTRALNELE